MTIVLSDWKTYRESRKLSQKYTYDNKLHTKYPYVINTSRYMYGIWYSVQGYPYAINMPSMVRLFGDLAVSGGASGHDYSSRRRSTIQFRRGSEVGERLPLDTSVHITTTTVAPAPPSAHDSGGDGTGISHL